MVEDQDSLRARDALEPLFCLLIIDLLYPLLIRELGFRTGVLHELQPVLVQGELVLAPARVVHDESRERGVPVENTDDYYAQDTKGTVWYMGEATTAYEKGKPPSTEGSWEAGVDAAPAKNVPLQA